YDEPRFRPTPLAAQRLAAGLLGRKSGEGFYRYAEGRIVPVAEPPPGAVPARKVWISGEVAARERVAALARALGAETDEGARPAADSLCVLLPWGADATTAAVEADLDPARCVAVDAWFGLGTRRTVMATPLTTPEW